MCRHQHAPQARSAVICGHTDGQETTPTNIFKYEQPKSHRSNLTYTAIIPQYTIHYKISDIRRDIPSNLAKTGESLGIW